MEYTFPEGPPDVLKVKMTYEQFLNLMTNAWIKAGKYEQEPEAMFRRALFFNLDTKMAELHEALKGGQ